MSAFHDDLSVDNGSGGYLNTEDPTPHVAEEPPIDAYRPVRIRFLVPDVSNEGPTFSARQSAPVTEIHTNRLVLRELITSDDEFVCELMNDAAWLANIGDRGIRTRHDARRYLLEGPWARYRELGFGFYAAERLGVREPIGVCGLAKRDHLDAPDIGFAFLSAHRGMGYAREAADAVLRFAASIGLSRVVATTRPENRASRRILEKLNMVQESSFISPSSGQPVLLYSLQLPPAGQDSHGS